MANEGPTLESATFCELPAVKPTACTVFAVIFSACAKALAMPISLFGAQGAAGGRMRTATTLVIVAAVTLAFVAYGRLHERKRPIGNKSAAATNYSAAM